MRRKLIASTRLFIGLLCLLYSAFVVEAADFRSPNSILTPGPLPEGARPVSEVVPVDRTVVTNAVRRLFAACCHDRAALEALISEDFRNRSRILDNFAAQYPRDSKLRVLGIQSIQTLDQHIRQDSGDGSEWRVSRVSVNVRGQLEFNDPEVGFVRLPTAGDYIFRIEERLK